MQKNKFFRRYIIEFLRQSIIAGKKVLISGENIAEEAGDSLLGNNQNIFYLKNNIKSFETDDLFDYIIFNEGLTYEEDLYKIFSKIKKLMHRDSKVFIIEINPLHLSFLKLLNRLGLAKKKLERNMLHLSDLENLVSIFGFDILDKGYRFSVPFRIFGLGDIINTILPRTKFFRHFCFGQYIVFRLHPLEKGKQRLSCSVVVPCHNEEDNVRQCILRIPDFGLWREIIVVNDGSTDRTEQIVREMMQERKDLRLVSYKDNRGKGYAVNKGWEQAKGDVFMMLDCDCTTPPEELTLFHDAMENGTEFINGTRVVYPREKNSIPFLNRLGVSFFAHLISWIIQKRVSDTFCGTKVFLKKHWGCFKIKEFLWGDWDLFFTAARYRMKMLELAVHYKVRRYGKTKMRPLKHGLILLFKSIEGLKIVK